MIDPHPQNGSQIILSYNWAEFISAAAIFSASGTLPTNFLIPCLWSDSLCN